MDTPTVTVMQTVVAAMGDVFTLVGTIITKITEQPVLLFLLAAGLIPVGIRMMHMRNIMPSATKNST